MSPALPDKPLRLARLLAVVRGATGRDFDKAALLQVLGSLSEALSVALIVPLLHLMGGNGGDLAVPLGGFTFVVTLPFVLVAFVTLIVVRSLSLQRKEAFNARVTFGFAETMTARLFAALAVTRWSVVSRWRTADMSHVLTGNGDRLRMAISQLLNFVQSFAMATILTVLSLFLSWQMTVVALVVGLILIAVTFPLRRRSLQQGRQLTEARREQYRITDEFLNGLRTAKAFGLEDQHVSAMRKVLGQIREAQVGFMVASARTATIFQISTAFALAVFVYFALSIADLTMARTVTLLFLYMRLAPRIVTLHTTSQDLLTQIGGVEDVLAMLDAAEAAAEAPDADPDGAPLLGGDIALAGVSFGYEGSERLALDGVSIVVPAGRITAIVGPTGSGKSTLVDMVMGLIAPDRGEIRIGGMPLAGASRRGWQGRIGYVPQETFLFNATIAENLRLANPAASDEELWDALRTADAANLVRALPGGLDHTIGDRGRSLSGGERQRLAIARALARKPDLLILDEATSALDALSQRRVAEALRTLPGGVTVIAVAHRTSMVAYADHVVVLERGMVTSSGSFDQLLAAPGGHLREIVDADSKYGYRPRPIN